MPHDQGTQEWPGEEKLPIEARTLLLIERMLANCLLCLYRNVRDKPYMRCEIVAECSGRTPREVHLSLSSKDFRAWLRALVWSKLMITLTPQQVERVIEVLDGLSLRRNLTIVTDPELLRVLQTEPMVATVVEYLFTNSQFKGSMESLWKTLTTFAKDHDLLAMGKKHFPKGPNALSKQFRKNTLLLLKLGVVVELKRSNGCHVILQRTDAYFTGSSEPNPATDNNLSAVDDDEPITKFKARKAQEERNTHDTTRSTALVPTNMERNHRQPEDETLPDEAASGHSSTNDSREDPQTGSA